LELRQGKLDDMTTLTFYGIRELTPGPRWRQLFDATWSGYRNWYLSEGESTRPSLESAHRMLKRHMPELTGTWERLVELSGGDETAARMLTLYDPPRFAPGCSQVALTGETPMLIRNYDYRTGALVRVVYSSALTGRRVIGYSDCLWGLLDGMNDGCGLAMSLAFGGRRGAGFGIRHTADRPLRTRGCRHRWRCNRRVGPGAVNMAYNLTILDRNGETASVFVAPGSRARSLCPLPSNQPPWHGSR
jgi:predicted choloylglycine hydrolase